MFNRIDAKLDVVLRRRLLDTDVRGRPEPELVSFVEDRLELVAIDRDDLQAVRAPVLDVANPRADLGRRSRPSLAHDGIHENAR